MATVVDSFPRKIDVRYGAESGWHYNCTGTADIYGDPYEGMEQTLEEFESFLEQELDNDWRAPCRVILKASTEPFPWPRYEGDGDSYYYSDRLVHDYIKRNKDAMWLNAGIWW